MTTFQKEAIIEYYNSHGPMEAPSFADCLFRALEINTVEFEPLVIPVFELEFEKVIPSGYLTEFIKSIKSIEVESIMCLAIVFDLYIPSKKWVANIVASPTKAYEYMGPAISSSVSRTLLSLFKDTVPFNDIQFIFGDKMYSLSSIMEDAVKMYLNKNGITHPLNRVPELRVTKLEANGLLIAPDKIDSFIYKIKK